jgi:hypothetical protein
LLRFTLMRIGDGVILAWLLLQSDKGSLMMVCLGFMVWVFKIWEGGLVATLIFSFFFCGPYLPRWTCLLWGTIDIWLNKIMNQRKCKATTGLCCPSMFWAARALQWKGQKVQGYILSTIFYSFFSRGGFKRSEQFVAILSNSEKRVLFKENLLMDFFLDFGPRIKKSFG